MRYKETYGVHLTLVNDSGGNLEPGQEVIINGDLTVDKRDAGTEFPIGVITVGGADGEKITVLTDFKTDVKGIAKGAPLTAGAFVKPDGTLGADNRVNFVATAAGDYASAVVLQGGAAAGEIYVGVLRSALKI